MWVVEVDGVTYIGDYGSEITMSCVWYGHGNYSVSVDEVKDPFELNKW